MPVDIHTPKPFQADRGWTIGLQEYALGWEVRSGVGGKRAEHSGKTGDIVTYYLRLLDTPIVVALAYSYEPKTHPQPTANELARLAQKAGAP